ncbi:hypothetical protein [Kocuria sp. CPCC 204721]|uniref:hypothetical protein n=1 Tax=Kocuria sp. CPCC 204721 TaxID=3073548 RepID=UPI0034D5A393
MAVTIEPTGKKIGATTMGSTAGGTLAGAATVVLVWLFGAAGVDVPPEVAAAFTVFLGGRGTLLGGKLTPSNQTRTVSEVVTVPQEAATAGPSAGEPAQAPVLPEVTAGSTAVGDPASDLIPTDDGAQAGTD